MKHEQDHKQDPYVMSYMTLRRTIGVLGILLPYFLIGVTIKYGRCDCIQDSISHYYYTSMGDYFVGFLCAIGIFLITYKGLDKIDNRLCNLAGTAALLVAFFPTGKMPNSIFPCTLFELSEDPAWRIGLHYGSAAVFFLTVAGISAFIFTKSSGTKTKQKTKRNRLYYICAAVIVISIAVILIFTLCDMDPKFSILGVNIPSTFGLETVALTAFGLSWLTKGKVLLKDK